MIARKNRPRRLPTLLLFAIFVLFLLPACGREYPRAFERGEDSGWIGVYVQDLDDELRDYLDIDTRYGVMVNSVVENSPAEASGLREQDVIIRFDGRRVRGANDLTRIVRRRRPGDRVDVEVIRDGRERSLRLRIGERGRSFARAPRADYKYQPPAYSFSDNRRSRLGVRPAELNEDLAQYFDVDANRGVLILSVEEDSPADHAGLKGGDVILEINEREVTSVEELAEEIRRRRPGDEVEIRYKRRGWTRSTTAELESARQDQSWSFKFNFNPEIQEHLRENLREREHLREFRDRMRELRDRIRIEVRDNLRDDARPIRGDVMEWDGIELIHPGDVIHRIHENINEHINENIHVEINEHLNQAVKPLHELQVERRCDHRCRVQTDIL